MAEDSWYSLGCRSMSTRRASLPESTPYRVQTRMLEEPWQKTPGIVLVVAACLLVALLFQSRRHTLNDGSRHTESKLSRQWTLPQAQSFRNIAQTEAPRYRPFKWGDYKLNMGIRFIPEIDWLPLYKSYPAYIRLREMRHKTMGKDCVDIVPHASHRNHLACLEAARAIAAYLAARYPDLFVVEVRSTAGPGYFGQNVIAVRRLACSALDLPEKRWSLSDIDAAIGETLDGTTDNPMQVAGELLPDDLAILLPDEDGYTETGAIKQYRFIAGSICTAGFWRLTDKLNCTLQDIHLDGKVPQYKERLQGPMDRFFTRMEAGGHRLAERKNYFFQVYRKTDSLEGVLQLRDGSLKPGGFDAKSPHDGSAYDKTEMTWGVSTNGPEEMYDPVEKGPRLDAPPKRIEANLETPITRPEDLVMRTERQTLRKLPISGAVLFTIHTHMVPLSIMIDEPGVPARLAHAMRNWPDAVAWYKAAHLYKDAVLPYLDAKAAEQAEAGLVGALDEEEKRAKQQYPL